jgi:O-methyltransferase involved in polyketide biosynthesis
MSNSARISPTAHYTGHVWWKHGLSEPSLATRQGAVLYWALKPVNLAYGASHSGLNLETALLARHRAIDDRLAHAVQAGEVAQVLEIAAGRSARGLRFRRKFPGLRYVEADLPAMASGKAAVLRALGADPSLHRAVHVDALATDGPTSVAEVLRRELDPCQPMAVVMEGLASYLDRASVEGIWGRLAAALGAFPAGLFLSDGYVRDETLDYRAARAFLHALGWFARGRIHVHHRDVDASRAALLEAGFGRAELAEIEARGGEHRPPMMRMIVAEVGP